MKKIKADPTHLTQLFKQTAKTNNRNQSKNHLRNHLLDHPQTYLAPEKQFVVASTGLLNLNQRTYKELLPDIVISNYLLSYILSIFIKQYAESSVQFECYFADSIINPSSSKVFKVKKEILLAVHFDAESKHCKLLIVNSKDKTFAVIDPLTSKNPTTEYFASFLNFVEKHNRKTNDFKLSESSQWTVASYEHQVQTDNVNSAIFVLNFIKQFLKFGKIDQNFSPNEYRKELQHFILRNSIKMTARCIICGQGKKDADALSCDCCSRWTHETCADDNIHDRSIHYFCLICVSNTSRTVLRNLSNDQNALDNVEALSLNFT